MQDTAGTIWLLIARHETHVSPSGHIWDVSGSLSDSGLECQGTVGPGGSCFIPLHYCHNTPEIKNWLFPHRTLSIPLLTVSLISLNLVGGKLCRKQKLGDLWFLAYMYTCNLAENQTADIECTIMHLHKQYKLCGESKKVVGLNVLSVWSQTNWRC